MIAFLLGAVVVSAAVFAFLNGFRDASAAVALSVRTRALTANVAVLLAALFNCLGALSSVVLTSIFADKLFIVPEGKDGLILLLAALISASLWGIFLWWRGFPSSSTHALISSLIGASLGSAFIGHRTLDGINVTMWSLVLLPLILSPMVAFILGFAAVYPSSWMARNMAPNRVNRRARQLQSVAGAAVAFGHGLQDGQRTTAVVLLALVSAGTIGSGELPLWVPIFTAVLLAVGTLFGGWRISYTLGHRLVRIDPLRGSVAQMLGAGLLFIGAIVLHMPLSTTHAVTAAIAGAGANQRFAATNGRVLLRIASAWIATPVVCVALGVLFFLALSPLG